MPLQELAASATSEEEARALLRSSLQHLEACLDASVDSPELLLDAGVCCLRLELFGPLQPPRRAAAEVRES